MRKIKLSLICTLAALLCCTLFAFIGFYAYEGAQNTLNTNTETTEEIAAPEHGATSGGLITEQEGEEISAPDHEAKAAVNRDYSYMWPEWMMGTVVEDYERETDVRTSYCHNFDFAYYKTIYATGDISIYMSWIMGTWGENIFDPDMNEDFHTYLDSRLSIRYSGSQCIIDTSAMKKGESADIDIYLPDDGYWDYCQDANCMYADTSVTLTIVKCDTTKVLVPYFNSSTIESPGSFTLRQYTSSVNLKLPDGWSTNGATGNATINVPGMIWGNYTITMTLKSTFDRSKSTYYVWSDKTGGVAPRTITGMVTYQFEAPIWENLAYGYRTDNSSNFGAGMCDYRAYITDDIVKLGTNDYLKQYYGWDFLEDNGHYVTASAFGNISIREVDGEVALDLSEMSAGESANITFYLPTGGYWQWHSSYSENDSSTDSFTITAVKLDKPTPPTITCATTVTYGDTLTLTGTGVGNLSWSRYYADRAVAEINGNVLTPLKVGTIRVTLTASGTSTVDSASVTTTITVLPKPIAVPTLSKGTGVHSSATVDNQTATTKYTAGAQYFTISSTDDITFGAPSTGATRSGKNFYATSTNENGYTVSMSIDSTKYCWGDEEGGTADRTLTIIINKGDQAALTITGDSSVVYSNSITLTAGGGSGTGAYSWTSSDTDVATIDSTGKITTVMQGEVTITLTKAGDSNYEEATKTFTVKVLRKAIAVPTLTAGSGVHDDATISKQIATTPYNHGLEQHFVITTDDIDKILFGDAPKGAGHSGIDFYATNAGEYILTMDLDYDKYCWGTVDGLNDVNQKQLIIKITKKSQTPEITSTATSVVYGSSITMTGKGEGTLKWSSSNPNVATVDETTGVITTVSAGTVTITLTAAGNDDYAEGSISKEIEVKRKAIAVPTISTGAGVHASATVEGLTATTTHNGNAQHFTLSSVENITFGQPSSNKLTISGTDFYATDVNANGYTVSLTIDSTKYCWGDTDGGSDYAAKTLKLIINKPAQTVTITGNSTVEYGGTLELTGTGAGNLSWTSSDETVATVDANGVVTALKTGTVTITLTAAGDEDNAAGSATKTITVTAKNIGSDDITIDLAQDSYPYDGNAKTPAVTVKDGSKTLTKDTDYTVEYSDNVNAGTATVTITGKGNYTGTVNEHFTITSLSLNLSYGTVTYGSTASPTLTGNDGNGTPAYTVEAGTGAATIDHDTGVLTPTKAGTVKVTVEVPATGNYSAGIKIITVTIVEKAITDATITVTAPSNQTYTGSALTPTPTVTDGTTTLVEGTDYTLTYKDNVDAGSATVTITGKGNYAGTTSTSFTIGKASITVTLSYGKVTYGEDSEAPTVGGNLGNGGVSFTVEAGTGSANINASTGVISPTAAGTVSVTVTIAESANYLGGSKTESVTIAKAKPTATVAVVDGKYYIGDLLSSVKISVTNSSVEGTVKWNNGTSQIASAAGSYGWTFTPDDDNYDVLTGTLQVTAFAKLESITVTGATTKYNANDTFDTSKLKVTASYASGKEDTVVSNYTIIYPTAGLQHFVIADDGKDVTISYTENGITVTATVTISITASTYDMEGVSLEDLSVTYDGEYHTLQIEGDLPDGVRFKYFTYNGKQSVSGVKNAGTYEVAAVFEIDEPENYKMPTLSAQLEIKKAKPQITISIEGKTFVYDGTEQEIDDIATVNNDEQEIKYSGNTFTNVPKNGTLKITVLVEESDNYLAAKQTVTVNISKAQPKINTSKVKTDYVYDGTTQKVESGATVDNDEQEIKYSDNTFKNVPENGKQTVTISVEESDNYLAASTTVEITVDKAKVENVFKFNDKEVTYDGSTHKIEVEGELGDDLTVVYYYAGTEDKFNGETSVKYQGKNYVGYDVTVHFICTSGNYYEPTDMTATLTIKPYTVTEKDISNVNDTYGYTGAPVKPDPVVKVTMKNGETTLGKDEYTVAYSTEDYTVGTEVTVTVTVNIDGNIVGTVDKVFTITKATITVDWDDAGSYVYDNTRQGVGVNGVNGFTASDAAAFPYTVTYSGRGDTTYSSPSKPRDAGLYTVTVTFDEDAFENYQLASEGALSKQFEIKKATVTLTVKVADHGDLYEGGKLPEISVDGNATVGELIVTGKLEWQQVNGEPLALEYGPKEYTWVFTPNDTANFNVKTGTITFTAGQATVTGVTVGWRNDIEIPTIYTSTTLNEIRDYLKVVGTLSGGGTTEIAQYGLTGDWNDKTALNPATDEAGTHVLTVTFKGFTATISVEYEQIDILELKVEAATAAGITKVYNGLDTFDKASVTVTVVYSDGTEKVVTNYTVVYEGGHEELWAGDEKVTVSYGGATKEIDGLTVNMNTYDPSALIIEDLDVDYDGTAKSYKIKGNFVIGEVHYTYQQENEQGVLVTVLPENVKDAGEYQVAVSFTVSAGKYAANYYDTIATKYVTLTIHKVEYAGVKDIAFKSTSVDYNLGNSVASQIEELLQNVPQGVKSVSFTYTDATGATVAKGEVKNAGKYTVTVSFEEDGNHFGISPITIDFFVNKVKPVVEPAVGGSLIAGTRLNQLTFTDSLGAVAGTLQWTNAEQELKDGVNRCYYVFTPEDAANYEKVTGYIDLEVGVSSGSNEAVSKLVSNFPDWAWYTLLGATLLAIVLALIGIGIARKKPSGDSDGFYDTVTEADLQ